MHAIGLVGTQYRYGGNTPDGGFDWTTAVVGGRWDSLLSEGRRWWITTNSDLHLKESDATRVGDFPTGPGWEAGATLANFNRAGRTAFTELVLRRIG